MYEDSGKKLQYIYGCESKAPQNDFEAGKYIQAYILRKEQQLVETCMDGYYACGKRYGKRCG